MPSGDSINILIRAILEKSSKAQLIEELKKIEQTLPVMDLKIGISDEAQLKLYKSMQKIEQQQAKMNATQDKAAEKALADNEKQLQYEQKVRMAIEQEAQAQKKQTAEIEKQISLYKEQLAIRLKNAQTTYGKSLSSNDVAGINGMANGLDVSNFADKSKQIDLAFQKATSSAAALRKETTLAMKESDNFFTTLAKDAGKMVAWTIVGTAIFGTLRSLKQGLDTLQELDSLMVDINKVTNLSADAMVRLKDSSFETASSFGRTAQDYLKAIAEFSRAGYEGQAEGLSKVSLLAQNVGELTAEQANQFLLATDAAYKYSGSQEELTKVLDGVNQIDNKFATSIQKVSEGISVAGSISSNANVSISELSAAIGTMTAVTQKTGNEAGRAFRGILMNIRQIKGETEDGEIIDDAALSKSAKALDSVGIKVHELRNGVEELRNPMDVLKDLSNIWDSLSTMKQSPIIEALGGKYRGNQLVALLENWTMYEKMLNEYANSANSAMKENAIRMDSWKAKINQFTNAVSQMWNNAIDTNVVKNIITLGTHIVNLVDKIGLLTVVLGAATLAFSLFSKTAFAGIMTKVAQSVATLAVNLGLATGAAATLGTVMAAIAPMAIVAGISLLVSKIVEYAQDQKKLNQAMEDFVKIMPEANKLIEQYNKSHDTTDLQNAISKINEENVALETQIDILEKRQKLSFASAFANMSPTGGIQYAGEQKQLENARQQQMWNDKTIWGLQQIAKAEAEKQAAIDAAQSSSEQEIKSIEELSKQVKTTVTSVKELNDIQSDLAKGTTLTADSMIDLITNYPELLDYIHKTADGYTIESQGIELVKQALIDKQIVALQTESGITDAVKTNLQSRLDLYGIELESIKTLNDARNATSLLLGSNVPEIVKQNPGYQAYANSLTTQLEDIAKLNALKDMLKSGLKIGGKSSGTSTSDYNQDYTKELTRPVDIINDKIQNLTNQYKMLQEQGKSVVEQNKKLDDIIAAQLDKQSKLLTAESQMKSKQSSIATDIQNLNKNKKIDLSTATEDQRQSFFNTLSKTGKKNFNEYIKDYDALGKSLAQAINDGFATNFSITDLLKQQLDNSVKDIDNDIKPFTDKVKAIQDKLTGLSDTDYSGKSKLVEEEINVNIDAIREYDDAIKSLNSRFGKSMISSEDYKTALDNLKNKKQELIDENNKLVQSENDSALKLYEDSNKQIIDLLKDRYDQEEKLRQRAHEDTLQELDDEKKAYQDYINDKIDALDKLNATEDYNKDVADQSKVITDIQKEIDKYSLAANSGDLEAIAKVAELKKQKAEEEAKLTDTQTKRERDLRKENLKDNLKDFEDYIDKKKRAEDDSFETYKRNLEDATTDTALQIEAQRLLMQGSVTDAQNALITLFTQTNVNATITGQILQDQIISKLQQIRDIGNNPPTNKSSRHDYGMSDTDYNAFIANGQAWNAAKTQIEKNRLQAANDALRKKYGIPAGKYPSFDVEGFTGFWSSGQGKLAMVHPEEFILKKETVANLLQGNLGSILPKINMPNTQQLVNRSGATIQISNLINVEGNVTKDVVPLIKSAGMDIINKLKGQGVVINNA